MNRDYDRWPTQPTPPTLPPRPPAPTGPYPYTDDEIQLTLRDFKPTLNSFLWTWLPSTMTLADAETLALKIYGLVLDAYTTHAHKDGR